MYQGISSSEVREASSLGAVDLVAHSQRVGSSPSSLENSLSEADEVSSGWESHSCTATILGLWEGGIKEREEISLGKSKVYCSGCGLDSDSTVSVSSSFGKK